jgi:hypothetical protein
MFRGQWYLDKQSGSIKKTMLVENKYRKKVDGLKLAWSSAWSPTDYFRRSQKIYEIYEMYVLDINYRLVIRNYTGDWLVISYKMLDINKLEFDKIDEHHKKFKDKHVRYIHIFDELFKNEKAISRDDY